MIRSARTSKETSAAVIGMGWQCGKTCQTLFIACRAATSAETSTSPFSTGPSRIARAVVGRRRMVPVATARRFTSGFRPMSTIFAIASGWEAALFLSHAFVNGSSRSIGVSRDTPPAGDAFCHVEMSAAPTASGATATKPATDATCGEQTRGMKELTCGLPTGTTTGGRQGSNGDHDTDDHDDHGNHGGDSDDHDGGHGGHGDGGDHDSEGHGEHGGASDRGLGDNDDS